MGRLVRLLVAALLGLGGAAVVVVGIASPASACSCAVGPPEDRAAADALYAAAGAVFTGRLVDRDEPGVGLDGVSSSGDLATVTFAVDTVYKGRVAPRQDVLTPQSGASCGLELNGEGPFLMFAEQGADGALRSYLCSGNTDRVDLATWPGSSPDPAVDGDAGAGPSLVAVSAGVLAAAGAALAVVVVLRRMRGPGRPAE